MAISRPQQLFTRMRRHPWPALVLMTAVAAEAGNVYYYWEPDDLPGCDEPAVRHQLRGMLERGAGGAASVPVKLTNLHEADAAPANAPETARRCTGEATVGRTTSTIAYEIALHDADGEYRITLHKP
jgi:hypothetical protein